MHNTRYIQNRYSICTIVLDRDRTQLYNTAHIVKYIHYIVFLASMYIGCMLIPVCTYGSIQIYRHVHCLCLTVSVVIFSMETGKYFTLFLNKLSDREFLEFEQCHRLPPNALQCHGSRFPSSPTESCAKSFRFISACPSCQYNTNTLNTWV